ncbi:hypothetical protein VSS37_06555 [Candidatus Thiothrix sp. Deng01]|uniref:DUF3426 domain-containing protein n=1 Tax=Candidatus Thiothrix phosphatis TaxID=3112415 RepID=A0ABU6CX27_9GAMM|nr:hypothetical protein [Candidatus Thiothrix sp. Deng01]MEB4590632.1 hypothetical protein [Candidatus Thiothrix sp. Deng01]
MYKPAANILALLWLLGASACATPPATGAGVTFATDASTAPVAFRSLRVENSADGQPNLIKGQIHLTRSEPVRLGHVDYTVLDAQGHPQENGWVEHSSAIRLRNAHRPSLFSIQLRQPLTRGETVRLSYHIGQHP